MQKRDYPRGEANFFVLLSVGYSLCSPPTPEPNCGFSFDDEVDLLFHFSPLLRFLGLIFAPMALESHLTTISILYPNSHVFEAGPARVIGLDEKENVEEIEKKKKKKQCSIVGEAVLSHKIVFLFIQYAHKTTKRVTTTIHMLLDQLILKRG
ncbi:hypothetical protein B9Z55_001527 [Caenorhabditis nigoni]|uniref:Uncharacterized protein n=1 Tax=Caenorhabditis nigoni TaxID=1611254 RepID=A0A2G5VG95_9PELO|nr:hypothetical protein B9Z55_001527 [Caenorhabditis nigoni]